ncbi:MULTISPECIES: hypothetical protein [Tritonibacter]|uniref:Uncharacterized protein n=1 Tax=Tritonibacter scottomollicae TaxID=483013 RepID=A0A2T1ANV8_TRISK|nr:hypothetical protein [Tritonibacter scottomollicae]PRZ50290.1 hypothetical protein CLV89_101510 [Tritonibacter scottomollicae]WOI31574.1 hypothetical protein R1T40_11395 [Tritonibacter scottomollicae]
MPYQEADPSGRSELPEVAARYKAAVTPATTQQLAKAMAQLQKSAAGAVFPREATKKDTPVVLPSTAGRRQGGDNVEYALLARHKLQQTSEREASRRYAGAKTII